MVYCQIEKQQEPGAPEDDENIDVVELKIYPSDAAQSKFASYIPLFERQ